MEEELKRIGRQARRRPIRPVRLRGNFPSQVERLPELTSPAVLEEIFSEAFRKTAARAEALRAGALTEDDIRAAEAFLDYVESDAAIKVFEDYGFTAYEAEDSKDATEASADNTEAEDSTASADSTSK